MALKVPSTGKIHGHYCGSNWTRGKNHPESKMFQLDFIKPIDALDRACMLHDEDIAKNGASRSGDLLLAKRATKVALTNPRLRGIALSVAAGMRVAAEFRKNQD